MTIKSGADHQLPVNLKSFPEEELHLLGRAIIIGASSGIGEALAYQLDASGYSVGLAARREALLSSVASKLKNPNFIKSFDLAEPENAALRLQQLIQEMGDVDLFIFSAGVGFDNPQLSWDPEKDTIAINVAGFTSIANVIARYFEVRGHGQLAAISSIAAIRGHGDAPAYGASKAFMSSYLNSLRTRFRKKGLPIYVTEIRPGFVATAMAQSPNLFWVASVETAANQILNAISKRSVHVYVTKRWALIAMLLRVFPNILYNKI